MLVGLILLGFVNHLMYGISAWESEGAYQGAMAGFE